MSQSNFNKNQQNSTHSKPTTKRLRPWEEEEEETLEIPTNLNEPQRMPSSSSNDFFQSAASQSISHQALPIPRTQYQPWQYPASYYSIPPYHNYSLPFRQPAIRLVNPLGSNSAATRKSPSLRQIIRPENQSIQDPKNHKQGQPLPTALYRPEIDQDQDLKTRRTELLSNETLATTTPAASTDSEKRFQNKRYEHDLYSPTWVKYSGDKKQGNQVCNGQHYVTIVMLNHGFY